MAEYKVLFSEAFYKSLRNIPKRDAKRIVERSNALGQNPRPVGCQKLAGQERYRIRQGNYRIIYAIEDDRLIVAVVKVGHRRHVYER